MLFVILCVWFGDLMVIVFWVCIFGCSGNVAAMGLLGNCEKMVYRKFDLKAMNFLYDISYAIFFFFCFWGILEFNPFL